MLKYYIISFALLSLVFSGCGSKSPEPLDEEVLDLEYVKKIEEEERKQKETEEQERKRKEEDRSFTSPLPSKILRDGWYIYSIACVNTHW